MFSLRMTGFRRPARHSRVWPWLRLRPSSQGIPASRVYPEQKARVTWGSVPHTPLKKTKQNKIKQMNCTSTEKGCSLVPRESVAENKLATDAKTKTPPLGNLMIKKCLQHQRLLIIYRSHQVIIIVCLPQSLVSYASGCRQTGVKHHKYIVGKVFATHCVRREWPQTSNVVVFINFCLYCSIAVQSSPVGLFKNPGLAHRAF